MRIHKIAAVAALGLGLLAAAGGQVLADHVKIPGTAEYQPAPAVVYPPQAAPAPGSPAAIRAPATIRADEIRANEVRAHTIYANRIEADSVSGAIHQTRGVRIENARGEVKAPVVAAAIIYAEEIVANSVAADVIYVRDLARR